MLRLRGVSKWFGAFQALRAVDFDVAAGEVVALVGANGAGKSTLMNVLAGRHADADYVAELDGVRLDLSTPAAALAAGIGVVPQEIDLVPGFTVAENMFLGREPVTRAMFGVRMRRPRETLERARRVLRQAELTMLDPEAKVETLTAEARQMAQIAKVLALESRVVVFDEPTARLSGEARQNLFSVIGRLRAAGKKVVFISHYLEEVFAVADRVVVLRDGRVVGNHAARELDVPALIALMVGDVAMAPRRDKVVKREEILVVTNLTAEPHFRDIDFSARAGEILGVAGILGSGRRELMRSLISRHEAAGSIRVEGEEIARSSASKVIGRHLGFVPEDRKRDGIVPRLSITRNISLPWLKKLSVLGVVKQTEALSRATALISRLGMVCSSPAQAVGELSGGNQQKAVLGRWLDSRLPLVLLEAPTVGVDVAGKEEIRRLVRALADSGMCVVISTDDIWELEYMTDRVLVMVRGAFTAEFRAGAMRRADLLRALAGSAPASPPGAGDFPADDIQAM
jgi:ribose transport system ATP-binding protein